MSHISIEWEALEIDAEVERHVSRSVHPSMEARSRSLGRSIRAQYILESTDPCQIGNMFLASTYPINVIAFQVLLAGPRSCSSVKASSSCFPLSLQLLVRPTLSGPSRPHNFDGEVQMQKQTPFRTAGPTCAE